MISESTLKRRLAALATASVLAIGAAGLAACGDDDDSGADDAIESVGEDVGGAAEDVGDAATDAAEETGDAAGDAADATGDAAGDAADEVGDAVGGEDGK